MKVVVQRVKSASVKSESIYNEIGKGYMLLVGIGAESTEHDVNTLAKKIINARLFEDEAGKMNLSIKDVAGEILSISQFTLYGDVKKGNRPSFTNAKSPAEALRLYELFNELLSSELTVYPGDFGEMMDISLVNDGPVTLIYESKDGKIQ